MTQNSMITNRVMEKMKLPKSPKNLGSRPLLPLALDLPPPVKSPFMQLEKVQLT